MTTSATAVVVLWAAAAAAAADVRSNDFYGRLGFGPGAAGDRDTCSPKVLGANLEVGGHDLVQAQAPAVAACGQACCGNPKCGGALFEPESTVKFGGCVVGQPCCFMKTSVAGATPRTVQGGSTLIEIPGRSQDDERLTFLSTTLGDHMVLQRAPRQAIVWGFTTPGAKVTTDMAMSGMKGQRMVSVAEHDGTWRQLLPPVVGSKIPWNFTFVSDGPAKETATMTDVLFGEVFLCGGQSNMEFAMPAVANAPYEKQLANNFPTIRYMTVGHRTSSSTPLRNLQSWMEPWAVASNLTINKDASPGHTLFSTFSAVCWLFGRKVSTELSATGEVPVGLISNNWGGTKVEVWVPSEAYGKCNRTGPSGPMWNAMILPYAVGPMQIAGTTWYQGEANTANSTTAAQYKCLFPEMITAWRAALKQPESFFGFVQLSSWCALPPLSLPQIRDAQMAALSLPNVGYATNADHGMGCTIHPAAKQYVSERLANAALAIQYKKDLAWKSPTFRSSSASSADGNPVSESVSMSVTFNDVGASGLELLHPFNYKSPSYGAATNPPVIIDCTATFPCGPAQNCSMAAQCAWASLQLADGSWVNATISVSGAAANAITLTADGAALSDEALAGPALGSSYGYGPIPMLSVYDKATGLPVLPWNTTAQPGFSA